MPVDASLLGGIEQTMARVRAVLDPSGDGRINGAQQQLFEYVSAQLVQFPADRNCPIVSLIDHIGNYWRNWLLVIIRTGPYRPSTLQKLLAALDPSRPISQRMLTLNLRMLERDGLIERRVFGEKSNHVEYALTPLGAELSDRLMSLIDWIDHHASDVAEARALFDARDP